MAPERAEHGVATVWAALWSVLLATVGFIVALGAAAEARQHQVDSVADLAALSAATTLERQVGDACATAARIARAAEVELASCAVIGADVAVTVHTRLALPFGLRPSITSSARAGPGP